MGSELECYDGRFRAGVLRCGMGRGLQSWRHIQPSNALLYSYKAERREEERGRVAEKMKPGGREFTGGREESC